MACSCLRWGMSGLSGWQSAGYPENAETLQGDGWAARCGHWQHDRNDDRLRRVSPQHAQQGGGFQAPGPLAAEFFRYKK